MIADGRIERGATPLPPAHRARHAGHHRHLSFRDVKHFTECIHTIPLDSSLIKQMTPTPHTESDLA